MKHKWPKETCQSSLTWKFFPLWTLQDTHNFHQMEINKCMTKHGKASEDKVSKTRVEPKVVSNKASDMKK